MDVNGSYETIHLHRADQPRDFWAVIEAAQYARMDHQEETASLEEQNGVEAFLDAFDGCAESWDEIPAEGQLQRLDELAAHLDRLAHLGFHVHVGTIERAFQTEETEDTVQLPVAVLSIGRVQEPKKQLVVPIDLAAGAA